MNIFMCSLLLYCFILAFSFRFHSLSLCPFGSSIHTHTLFSHSLSWLIRARYAPSNLYWWWCNFCVVPPFYFSWFDVSEWKRTKRSCHHLNQNNKWLGRFISSMLRCGIPFYICHYSLFTLKSSIQVSFVFFLSVTLNFYDFSLLGKRQK